MKATEMVIKERKGNPTFFLEGRKWAAKGRKTESGFTVFAGGVVNSAHGSFTSDKVYFPIRQMLEATGIIKDCMFTRDFTFKSAAQAGCICAAALIPATRKWHTEIDGTGNSMTYEECYPKAVSTPRTAPSKKARAASDRRKYFTTYRSKALIDGRFWNIEWRGQTPFRYLENV